MSASTWILPGQTWETTRIDWNQLYAGRRVQVARRPGIVYGLRVDANGQFVFVQYDDGFSQWVPLAFVEVL